MSVSRRGVFALLAGAAAAPMLAGRVSPLTVGVDYGGAEAAVLVDLAIETKFADSRLLLRRFTLEEMARIYRVPVAMLQPLYRAPPAQP
ncbi:MAG TPA: hypothetical protein VGG29_03495 [Caulobacteraceae bacterium]